MLDDKFEMFQNRLTKVFRHVGRQARRMGVTCYRVYDHDLPEFPLCIETYEERGYVAEYKRRHGMTEDEHDTWMEKCLAIVATVMGLQKENIFLKLRQRKPGRLGQYQKSGEEKHEFNVTEGGLKFRVNLSDYLDTGLFLDHRVTRQIVREGSKDKRILNLFAYTGSFSVYAAAGDAKEVVTVDLSKTYLEWSEQNLKLNAFDDQGKYKIVHADVLQWLPSVQDESFDMIIMDPPTFSNSKRMKDFLDIQQDHVALINHCMRILSPGGILYFSTNYRKFELKGENINASTIKDITKLTTPFDFEGRLTRLCYVLTK